MGVAELGALGAAGGVAIGAAVVADGVVMGLVEGVATGGEVEAALGPTENNSKSVTIIGIEGTEDSVACG